jgi:hypothetical protein
MTQRNLHKIPSQAEPFFKEVVIILEQFCKEKLNTEYFELSVALAAKIARKRPSPFLFSSGRSWAAGIVHALGMVNFLFDKSQSPHLSSKELCNWFQLSQSTVSAKSKTIRDMFRIIQLDPKWCLPSKLEDNPFTWFIAVNGFILDARQAPYELQLEAYRSGLIPYVPADKK